MSRTSGRLSFITNSGYAAVSAGSSGLLLILLMLAGRRLSATAYGQFSYALALALIVETIMDVGLGHVTVRAVARDRSAAGLMFRHILGLKLFWVGVGLALLFVAAPLLRSDPMVVRICYLLGISSAIRSYLLTARGLFQGLGRFGLEAAIVLADRVVLLVSGAAALFGGYGLMGLGIAFVAARSLMLVVVTLVLRRVAGSAVPTFDRAVWRELQAAALPLGLFMIALNTYSYIDTVILGFMRTDAEIGWYNASYRVYEGLTYAPQVLAAVLTPRLSYLFVHERHNMRSLFSRVLALAALLGLALGATTVWLAAPLMTLLFGSAYGRSTEPLQILAGGAFFVFCTWILHAAAIATNLDRRLVITTVIGLATNVLLNLALIPRWGISGSAAATVLAEAVTVGLLFFQVRRRMRDAAAPSAA